MPRWLELIPDYRCNNRCVGCYAVNDAGPSMTGAEALATLARGRRAGASSLWLGGGDPTLRRDLFGLVTAARKMGYTRVKLQTNGMMLAYPAFADRCRDAGVTEVAFAIKGATADTHDRLTRTPGCHALMVAGMDAARTRGLELEGDVLVYASNAAELPAIVGEYAARGVARFRVWLLSAADASSAAELRDEVPRIADVVPHLRAAMDLAASRGLASAPDFIQSLHTPACTVPAAYRRCLFDARALALRVENPGGYGFSLEDSPMEGGHYLPRCADCAARPTCNGLRTDYLAVHGDAEFQPIE